MVRRNLPSRLATTLWQRRHPDWAAHLGTGRGELGFHLSYAAVPRYALDRGRAAVRRRRCAEGHPWITDEARRLLESLLRPTDRVLEFGAGSSTEWFAAQVGSVVSIEASAEWHGRVAASLAERGLSNVELELAPAEPPAYGSDAHRRAFTGARADLETGSFDVVFVDGDYRDACALRGLDLLAPGGLLVLDNANTYLPGPSRSPWQVTRPASKQWAQFVRQVDGWRSVWTTNGLWDTALWFKP